MALSGQSCYREDIVFIREFIAQHPGLSRRRLSAKLCEAWQWKQANGALRDMVCRGLLLMLHRAGEIELPPVRQIPLNPFERREQPPDVPVDTTPLAGQLSQIRPIELRQVRRTAEEPLFNSLIEQHHYLGYEQPVGEHLKYLVWAQGRPIACLAWSSAPRHLGSRDRYIGWSAEARRRNIRFIAYNTRFLILPWVQVPHLASHILGRVAQTLIARLGTDVRTSGLLRGDLHRSRPFSRNLLSRRQLEAARPDHRARQRLHQQAAESIPERSAGLSADSSLPRVTEPVMKKKIPRRRIDVNVEELDRIIDGGKRTPLSESDGQKLKTALHALAERLAATVAKRRRPVPYSVIQRARRRKRIVRQRRSSEPDTGAMVRMRIAARRRWGSRIRRLAHGDRCPECARGNSLHAEGAESAGADRGAGAAGGHRVRAGATALQCLRAGVHGRGAGRRRPGKVR